MIDTRIVYGFTGAGKTSYIRACILNEYFYKYGRTLVLCFEQGSEVYDERILETKNAYAAYYQGDQEIGEFCSEQGLKKRSKSNIENSCTGFIRMF